jgi:Mo-co oxidoreductase dimerisation domain
MAYGGNRGISRVEFSVDDGKMWSEAKIYYPGTKLTWALWSYDWRPEKAGDYNLVARATDGTGKVQEIDWNRSYFSGVTGFHKLVVYIAA